MTRFQLAWDDTRTGRARIEDDESARPLVWVRITWGDGHEVHYVDVYGDGVTPGERRWLMRRPSVLDALMFAAVERARLRALDGRGSRRPSSWARRGPITALSA